MRYTRCFIANISSHLLMDRKGVFVACVSCASHCKMIVIMFYYYCVALYILCMSTVALCIVFNFSSGLLLEARKRLQRKWKLLLWNLFQQQWNPSQPQNRLLQQHRLRLPLQRLLQWRGKQTLHQHRIPNVQGRTEALRVSILSVSLILPNDMS